MIVRNPKVEQHKYFVGYMDILGYKDYFQKKSNDTDKFLDVINDAVDETIVQINTYTDEYKVKADFYPQIKLFSDNILIAVKCNQKNVDNFIPYLRLVKLMANIQLLFTNKYQLVLRGSIAKGMFYFSEHYVFGEALIKAYEMESKQAVFPKIILEPQEVEKIIDYINGKRELNEIDCDDVAPDLLKALCSLSIAQENDGTFFANYLTVHTTKYQHEKSFSIMKMFSEMYAEPSAHEKTISLLSSDLIDDRRKTLEQHRKVVMSKLKDNGNYDDLLHTTDLKKVEWRKSVILKYAWLLDYHNQACELAGFPNYRINCEYSIDPRVLQPYIKVLETGVEK